ncbi:hypothetical protein COCC4DRAFT_62024 [Bipolaris maydis ATCC 48331]|uniref:Uncharacterized protein n=2 Tax=Cochliobolus heterostrophus TaxID=5016 RepID=M2SNV0_COCH5|nr:uncharacterized protein COCC4DRAFT_62024 [Bipolaris maydis ATCC 48331]EMD86995.1 hypothetical protein COCHEDRAFT_1114777 [Bipolaris maydis C5]KAH7559783.1 hypothetical protein BM1_03417 [Bipolaris maydis]ENI04010.1 hypothetical protein COCC4DRAFT_62024 [Bipolaris maydis ATCC 48331]KAJ5021668.1 Zinc/iron permease [Bipolaris maydis]KAJ5055689.1 zinc-regulated transporter 1 [Bipolaris maydis]
MSYTPTNIDLRTTPCFPAFDSTQTNSLLSLRISSIFVICLTSTLSTCFPLLPRRNSRWKISRGIYTFARFFGTGVIIATAFIHLLDPAYEAIGPRSCAAADGVWSKFPWCAGIVLTSILLVFCVDLAAEVYVQEQFQQFKDGDESVRCGEREALLAAGRQQQQQHRNGTEMGEDDESFSSDTEWREVSTRSHISFVQQISTLLVLELGIIFHSVIIGLNLGVVASSTFTTLYPVLVFHQSFEGLGIGARLSNIHFPHDKAWIPWALCALYGLATPLAIAAGLGVRATYAPESRGGTIVQGIMNAASAGFLIYSALVELLAKDFLLDNKRTKGLGKLGLMVAYVFAGAVAMALLGYWA